MLTRPHSNKSRRANCLPARKGSVVLIALALLIVPARLIAHPMGNFSISHYAGITIQQGFIEIRYLLDMAEIPTFQELQQTGLSAHAEDPNLAPYLTAKAASLAQGLKITINGQPVALEVTSQGAVFPPGAGNLPTMKSGFVYRAAIPSDCAKQTCQLEYEDTNFPGRAGWKEVIAQPTAGVSFSSTSVPAQDRSAQLSNYPTDLLNSPPQVLSATVSFVLDEQPPSSVGTSAAAQEDCRGAALLRPSSAPCRPQPRSGAAAQSPTGSPSPAAPTNAATTPVTAPTSATKIAIEPNRQPTPRNAFTELMSAKEISFNVAWLAALIAIGLGALHALEPGHGKTIVAAYIVGAKGTARHAVLLGSIVTISHTAGVYMLGAVTLYAQKYIVPDQLYPFLGVASGLLIAGMGAYLFLQRYAGKLDDSHSHAHSHGPFGHTHSHDFGDHPHAGTPADGLGEHAHTHDGLAPHTHSHGGITHTHVPPDLKPGEKPSITQLLVLGITGGIVPCPAALVVLLSAVALHRVGFGLFLIVAFSLGLAGVLIAMGLAAVYARRLISRVPTDGALIQHWLPLTSAAMITILGFVIAVRGLVAAGIVQIHL